MTNKKYLSIEKVFEDFRERFDNASIHRRRVTCTSIYNRDERTPSMYIDLDKDVFYCFSTSQGGNQFKLLRDITNSKIEYDEFLLSNGYEISAKKSDKNDNLVRYSKAERKYIDILTSIRNYSTYVFRQTKLGTDNTSEILNDFLLKRKIPEEIQYTFDFGLVIDNDRFINYLIKQVKCSLEELEQFGLVRNGVFVLLNRLLIPLIDDNNKVLSFEGRAIRDEVNKYIRLKNIERLSDNYFVEKSFFKGPDSLEAVREKKEVIWVEGAFDLMRLYSFGIYNVYALLTKNYSNNQIKYIKKYNFEDIVKRNIVMMDNDKDTTDQITPEIATLHELKQNNILRFIYINEDKDPDIYFLNLGVSRNVYSHIVENSVNTDLLFYENELSKYKNDLNISFETFYKRVSKILGINPTLINILENEIGIYRQHDLAMIRNKIEHDLSELSQKEDKSILIHYLAKKFNSEVRYINYLFSNHKKRLKYYTKINEFEKYFDNEINVKIENAYKEKIEIKKSKLSVKHDVIKDFGKGSLRIEYQTGFMFIKISYLYLDRMIIIENRYRKNFDHAKVDKSNNLWLFETTLINVEKEVDNNNSLEIEELYRKHGVEKILDDVIKSIEFFMQEVNNE